MLAGLRSKVLAGCFPGFSKCSFHMTTVPSVRSEMDRARRTRPRSQTRVAACASSSWSSATPRPWSGGASRGVGAARNDAGGRSPSMRAERRNNQLRQENQPYIKYKVKGRCTLYSIYIRPGSVRSPYFLRHVRIIRTRPPHIGPGQLLLQQNRPTLARVTAGLARRRPLVAEHLATQQRHCAAAASSGATRARPRHVQAPLPARGGRAQRARSSAPRGQ